MRHDAAADPVVVDVGADPVDHSTDLAPGHRRQLGKWHRPRITLAEGGVQEVYAAGVDGDPDLVGGRVEIGQLVEDEVLGGAELVEADGVHALIRQAQVWLRSRWRPDV